MSTESGKIILLNGPSSAGKSTLCQALQDQLELPFLQFSMDFFLFNSKVLPARREKEGPFSWSSLRSQLFEGFYRCLVGLAGAGNNLVVEYIIETEEQFARLAELLQPFDVFFVGLHCDLAELERRELARGDRGIGDARRDYEIVHGFSTYDFEVDSSERAELNAQRIIQAWKLRKNQGVFATAAKAS
ncbi:MAG: hypothetical protein KC422_21200 [Trueperaceae bacterium]|nr:hypothetical protein [Trueperaceae bacterium]